MSHRSSLPARLAFGCGLLLAAGFAPLHAQETSDGTVSQEPAQMATTQDSVDRAVQLFAELQELGQIVDELQAREAGLTGEDSVLIAQRRDRRIQDQLAVADAWVRLVLAMDRSQPTIARQLEQADEMLDHGMRELRAERLDLQNMMSAMRVPRDSLRGSALIQLEKSIARQSDQLNRNSANFATLVQWYEDLGLDPGDLVREVDSLLVARADNLADRIQIVVDERRDLRSAIESAPDAEASTLALDMLALVERLDNNTSSLRMIADLIDSRGGETAEYRQLLISATGELTTDILDGRVAIGLVRESFDDALQWLRTEGLQLFFKLLLFAFIIFLSFMGARLVRLLIRRGLEKSTLHASKLMTETVLSLSGKAVIGVGFLIGLGQMGVALGPMLAGLGVAGFIVGFALQDTLSNFASGFMIVLYEPYDIGDLVEVAGGVRGKVDGMSLVSTTVKTLDNQLLVIPNTKIWGDVIQNVTSQRIRRVDLVIGVAYDADLQQTEDLLTRVVAEHELVLDDPEPIIKLHELGDSAVSFVVRPWCETDDYWEVYWDITRAAKEALDEAGIGIPFPQRDMHLHFPSDWTGPFSPKAPTPEPEATAESE